MIISEMNAETVARTIQLIIAPTVLLSVCTLVQNGILGRYTAIGDRMRKIDQDRLQLLENVSALDRVERLRLLERQIPIFVRRHTLLQEAALTVYVAILVLLICMFAIALCVVFDSNWLAILALVLFLVGAAILVIGVSFTAIEIRISHQAICYEMRRITDWGKN
jgi:Protein of unknown function (DUF2721)